MVVEFAQAAIAGFAEMNEALARRVSGLEVFGA